jgi:uncharacterized radical SAM superfamily protein
VPPNEEDKEEEESVAFFQDLEEDGLVGAPLSYNAVSLGEYTTTAKMVKTQAKIYFSCFVSFRYERKTSKTKRKQVNIFAICFEKRNENHFGCKRIQKLSENGTP